MITPAKINQYIETLYSTHIAALRDACNPEANEEQRAAYEAYNQAIILLSQAQAKIIEAATHANGTRRPEPLQFSEAYADFWGGRLPTGEEAYVLHANLGPGEKLVKYHTRPNTQPIIMVASYGGSLRYPTYSVIQ